MAGAVTGRAAAASLMMVPKRSPGLTVAVLPDLAILDAVFMNELL